MGLENLLKVTFFGAFKSYIALNRVEIMEDVEVERLTELKRSLLKKRRIVR